MKGHAGYGAAVPGMEGRVEAQLRWWRPLRPGGGGGAAAGTGPDQRLALLQQVVVHPAKNKNIRTGVGHPIIFLKTDDTPQSILVQHLLLKEIERGDGDLKGRGDAWTATGLHVKASVVNGVKL